jgi:hypothetical protein
MKQIILNVPDNKYQFFLELVKNLGFVKVKDEGDSKESPYDPEFVDKIKQSEKEFKEGNCTRVEKKDLKNFLGL